MYPKPSPMVIQSSKPQLGTLNSFGTDCDTLEAETAKVDLAQGLPGNAPSPMGSEVNLDDTECPGILSLCVLLLGIQQGRLLGQDKNVLLGGEGRTTL